MINKVQEIMVKINQINKAFLDRLQGELQSRRIYDISPTQVLLISNLGKESKNITDIGNNGYYLGKNISYNIKGLIFNEYLVCAENDNDRRAVRAQLTAKGLEILDIFNCVLKSQAEWLQKQKISFNIMNHQLESLEMSIKNG